MFQPVNLTAKRALTPFLPIAKLNCSFLTTATAFFSAALIATPTTVAGFNASAMYKAGFS